MFTRPDVATSSADVFSLIVFFILSSFDHALLLDNFSRALQSSTTTNTYVQVIYSSHGVDYDMSITVGSSGTAAFPILPASIEIRVGNTNWINGATETVTITYYY